MEVPDAVLDFHVGPEDHVAQLGRKHVPAVGESVAETVRAQYRVGVDRALINIGGVKVKRHGGQFEAEGSAHGQVVRDGPGRRVHAARPGHR